jgi:hypothetical protein
VKRVPGFLVFGRRSHTAPLQLEGRLEAGDGEAAQEALRLHGTDWLELTLVPEAAVTRVAQGRRRETDDG